MCAYLVPVYTCLFSPEHLQMLQQLLFFSSPFPSPWYNCAGWLVDTKLVTYYAPSPSFFFFLRSFLLSLSLIHTIIVPFFLLFLGGAGWMGGFFSFSPALYLLNIPHYQPHLLLVCKLFFCLADLDVSFCLPSDSFHSVCFLTPNTSGHHLSWNDPLWFGGF